MRALLRHSFMIYLESCHYLLPLVVVVMYSAFLYALIPIFELGGFSASVTILFTISLLDGFFAYKICSNDMRAVIVLKTGSAVKYYLSNELLFALLSAGYTALVLLYPCVTCVIHAERLNLGGAGELTAILLVHLLVALCGYQIGSLIQPNMIGKRLPTAALIFAIVFGMLLGYKLSMIPVVKYLFLIFPPIINLLQLLCTEEEIFSAEIGYATIQLALYTLILLVGKCLILSRRKWAVYE